MKKIWIPILILILLFPLIYSQQDQRPQTDFERPRTTLPYSPPKPSSTKSAIDDAAIRQAVQSRRSNVMVQSQGRVSRLLPDDNKGSRHQKFIITLTNGKTVLFAHNIDLAPRINSLQVDDVIDFYGQYEWNEKGGVVHWTHHDPANRHAHGWIRHNGKNYQ